MKTNTKIIALVAGLTGMAALTAMSRPAVIVSVPAPAVTVEVPAPVVTVAVPDYYVWDGVEFVGLVGGQYYYLGPGNVWLACDPVRLGRFHVWERDHADWRAHAIVNTHYRRDVDGHEHPWHNADRPNKEGHDRDHGHDHGHE